VSGRIRWLILSVVVIVFAFIGFTAPLAIDRMTKREEAENRRRVEERERERQKRIEEREQSVRSRQAIEACTDRGLARMRDRRSFERSGVVKCRAGGQMKTATVSFPAPSGYYILGDARVRVTTQNSGERGAVRYGEKDGQRVRAEVEIKCRPPRRPGGPGASMGVALFGEYERTLTPDDQERVRAECRKAQSRASLGARRNPSSEHSAEGGLSGVFTEVVARLEALLAMAVDDRGRRLCERSTHDPDDHEPHLRRAFPTDFGLSPEPVPVPRRSEHVSAGAGGAWRRRRSSDQPQISDGS